MTDLDAATRSPGLRGTTALVVGAGRGLGRGVAAALAAAGADVLAVARTADDLRSLAADVVRTLLARERPRTLALVAGASPVMAPLYRLSWEDFSSTWHADVRIAFAWIGEALRLPLPPGSTVVLFSSGAALQGSPLSGGYAGAKATQRFVAAYARDEAARAGLGLRFVTLLPRLTPTTDLGRAAVEAYAERDGVEPAEQVRRLGASLTPELAGEAVRRVLVDPGFADAEYRLTGEGLHPMR